MHTQDIGHLVNELQLWIRNGRLNSQDHGEQPLRNDREDNDLVDELQLRNFHSFLRDDTTDTRDRGDFLNKLQLWDLNDLHDQLLRNLHDLHNRDKDHLVRLRDNDGHVSNLVQELVRVQKDA